MVKSSTILLVVLISCMFVLILLASVTLTIVLLNLPHNCNRSLTTAGGSFAEPGPYCSGDLIFEDNFDKFDDRRWENENSLAGGGNQEFQWYTKDRSNSFVKNGILHIKPTLTQDYLSDGEDGLTSATVTIAANECTLPEWMGCERTGTPTKIINPIRSARLHTIHSFYFKYGRVEISAKLPTGDWLWPAIWMMPKESVYGRWPRSGSINSMDSRGNFELRLPHVGAQKSGAVLSFGPYAAMTAVWSSYFVKTYIHGFEDKFRRFQLEWSPQHVKFSIDDEEIGIIRVGDGFWERGQFAGKGAKNPWEKGTLMAPFDQEFYLIMNLAVGGTTRYFPDNHDNKPWVHNSETAARDFWKARSSWLPTWKLYGNDSVSSSLLIDYVRIWAI